MMRLNFRLIKDGPYEFVLDLINEKFIVIAVIEGGILHKNGTYML